MSRKKNRANVCWKESTSPIDHFLHYPEDPARHETLLPLGDKKSLCPAGKAAQKTGRITRCRSRAHCTSCISAHGVQSFFRHRFLQHFRHAAGYFLCFAPCIKIIACHSQLKNCIRFFMRAPKLHPHKNITICFSTYFSYILSNIAIYILSKTSSFYCQNDIKMPLKT